MKRARMQKAKAKTGTEEEGNGEKSFLIRKYMFVVFSQHLLFLGQCIESDAMLAMEDAEIEALEQAVQAEHRNLVEKGLIAP